MVKRVPAITAIALVSTLGLATAAPAQRPADCGGADMVVTGKIRALFKADNARLHDLASHSVPVLEEARAMCAGPRADAALRLYAQLLLYMEVQEAAPPAAASKNTAHAGPPPASTDGTGAPPADRR